MRRGAYPLPDRVGIRRGAGAARAGGRRRPRSVSRRRLGPPSRTGGSRRLWWRTVTAWRAAARARES